MTRLPLLLLIFVVFVANADNKMIEFICHKDYFRYHLSLLEEDLDFFGLHNFISHEPGTSSYAVRAINNQTFVHNYKLKGEDNNDGCIPWVYCNYTFEFWMKVIHDCTTDGSKHLAWYRLGDYYATEGNVTDTFNFNLTNAGDPTTDVIGTKKMARKQYEIHDYLE